ncbi:MAG: hypothetical protein NT023_23330 [Armatimonadetes bacterium]|nr:hypothetical protein [Armatimonadota bacterium]
MKYGSRNGNRLRLSLQEAPDNEAFALSTQLNSGLLLEGGLLKPIDSKPIRSVGEQEAWLLIARNIAYS